jgi:hypothetical protein
VRGRPVFPRARERGRLPRFADSVVDHELGAGESDREQPLTLREPVPLQRLGDEPRQRQIPRLAADFGGPT